MLARSAESNQQLEDNPGMPDWEKQAMLHTVVNKLNNLKLSKLKGGLKWLFKWIDMAPVN